jgi:hypothetical protein
MLVLTALAAMILPLIPRAAQADERNSETENSM